MIIRAYWPQRNDSNRTEPIDSFWVEATYKKAKKAIFPFLTPEAIECSKAHALAASRMDNPLHPYCFLVARDLSTIEPFDVHYPFHHMWHAYSPFKEFAECHINALEELKTFTPLSEPLRFYRLHKPYGFFSNFAPYAIYLKGKIWSTSEHYFQSQKFANTHHEEEIRLAQTPREAAEMGRDHSKPLRADWTIVKDDVMREALYAKFTQHPDLKDKLI